MPNEVFIGVDVCKPRMDLMILPTGEILEFENSVKGIKQFVKRPSITVPSSEHIRALEAIIARRRQLLEMKTMERNRLGSTREVNARASIEAVIAFLEQQEHDLDDQILELVRSDSELKALDVLLQSVVAECPWCWPCGFCDVALEPSRVGVRAHLETQCLG
jgi:hypothetical protein